jgi:hypothetical protein
LIIWSPFVATHTNPMLVALLLLELTHPSMVAIDNTISASTHRDHMSILISPATV